MAANETIYTPSELAKILKVHPETIRKTFRDTQGVIAIGNRKPRSGRRAHVTLRIPQSVAFRVFGDFGGAKESA